MDARLIVICHEHIQKDAKEPCANGKCKCPESGKPFDEHIIENNCPLGRFKEVQDAKPATQNIIQKAITFFEAQVTGKRVSLEIVNERVATCQQCQHRKVSPKGTPFCGMGCGCPTEPKNSAILKSLVEIEENLPKWGCKHPLRRRGKGWKR